MSYIRNNNGNYYLREKYKNEDGKWKERTLFRFKKGTPKKYYPLVIHGDAIEKMREIPHGSLGLVITSPPYWNIKDYGEHEQIGHGEGYNDYIRNLKAVWTECYRTLDFGSRLCINIGDQFVKTVEMDRYRFIPIHSDITQSCMDIGFDFMGNVIWQKVATMKSTGGGRLLGSYPYPKSGALLSDYEYIMVFKKPGKHKKPTEQQKKASKMSQDEWVANFTTHWKFPGVRQDSHIAMFPLELPLRLIKMFSFVGETVLDPFVGSGTALIASIRTGRKSVGIELNRSFVKLINQNIKREVNSHKSKYIFVKTEIVT